MSKPTGKLAFYPDTGAGNYSVRIREGDIYIGKVQKRTKHYNLKRSLTAHFWYAQRPNGEWIDHPHDTRAEAGEALVKARDEKATFKGREVPDFKPGPDFVRPRGWGYVFPMADVLQPFDEDGPVATLAGLTPKLREAQDEVTEYLKVFLRFTSELDAEVESAADEFEQIIDEMETFVEDGEDDQQYGDLLMAALYDFADANRIWMDPTESAAA